MSDWTSGYVADIGYTYGYYAELNPLRMVLPLLNAGLAVPTAATACELGFGQGMSINIHAAGSGIQWFGTDFNPSQAGFAQELAHAAGAGAKVYDQAFDEFANRADLPEFDFIGLHGIWSWISDANRRVIVEFLRRKLKVGGVLYVSYNTLPGWANFAPIRHLMALHAQTMGAPGAGVLARIDGSLNFTQSMLDVQPSYLRANTQMAERFSKVKEQNRHYLAHEYFNQDWHPMYFSDMAKWLAEAKLDYACSANMADHVDALNLTPDQQKLMKSLPDVVFRESVRDFLLNQQFRKDYWIRGARKLSALEQLEAQRAVRVVLVTHRPDVSLKIAGALGEATMSEAVYTPILDYLADHKPRTLAQIEQALMGKSITFGQMYQAIMILGSANYIATVQDEAIVSKSRKSTTRLNALLSQKARGSNEISFAASPVIGGAYGLSRFNFLFTEAMSSGLKQPTELAQYVWRWIAMQGQSLLKDGKQLTTVEENVAELTRQAEVFVAKQAPILKSLQIL